MLFLGKGGEKSEGSETLMISNAENLHSFDCLLSSFPELYHAFTATAYEWNE
jgi:hypothetical protein